MAHFKPSILIVDDEQLMREMIREAVMDQGYAPLVASNTSEARIFMQQEKIDLLITDLNMPGESGLDLVNFCKSHSPDTCVIVITAFPDVERARALEELEVSSLLIKPFSIKQLKYSILTAVEKHRTARENKKISVSSDTKNQLGLVGVSQYLQSLRRQILLFASGDFPVLIQGESGTGKEVIAHAIHGNSARSGQTLITINCAAIPRHLEESEFFGHTKGAFTGAHSKKIGIIESANNSTLFLDEIGELSLGVQAKLLRVLDTGEYTRVGDVTALKADIRIISATNRNLEEMIAGGQFRKDLYFRIKAASVTTQSLLTHAEDIPHLVRHFINMQCPDKQITPDAAELLYRYSWPGNIRELKHVIHLLCTTSAGQKRISSTAVRSVLKIENTPEKSQRFCDAKTEFELGYFTTLLRKHSGNLSRVAVDAGLHRPNLIRKLRDLKISTDAYRAAST